MSKRFKFKLPRLISSSFQICRSRNSSTFPDRPMPSPKPVVASGFPHPPPSTPEDDSIVSVKLIRGNGLDADSIEYSWREDGKWHVVNKRPEDEPEPVIIGRYGKCKKDDGSVVRKRDASSVSMRVLSSCNYGSSVAESVHSSSARFSKEEEEEDKGQRVASVSLLRRTTSMDSDGTEVENSVAVVKRSENPLEDFRTSMIEMVVERGMFGARDLEHLLRCFLSLNSREYHGTIVEAFSDLWQMMFVEDDAASDFTK